MNRKYIPELRMKMKLNKVQKVIAVIAVILFTWIGASYYLLFYFNPIKWSSYIKSPEEWMQKCNTEREEHQRLLSVNPYLKYQTSFIADCNQPQIISVYKKPVHLRQKTISDTLFTYSTIGIVTGLLLFLTKDLKRK